MRKKGLTLLKKGRNEGTSHFINDLVTKRFSSQRKTLRFMVFQHEGHHSTIGHHSHGALASLWVQRNRKTLTSIWPPLWWFESWAYLRFWGDGSWALFINHLPSSSIHLFLLMVVGFFSCPGSEIRNIPKKIQFQFISAIGWEHQRYLQGRGNLITTRFWNWALQRECDENHCRFLGPQFLRIRRPSDLVEIFAFENTKIKSKTEGVWTRSNARS